MGDASHCLWFKFPNADGTRFPNAEIRLRVPKALAFEKEKWVTFAEKSNALYFFYRRNHRGKNVNDG
ncbi:hypothetical protein [Candidatus Sodalis pierantonius]|uniref:hypothetical protein n=1 Tax=Candidatus Sodalis pierantonii TaxID=1486991 RepID=UPI00046CEB87|nr:hypothetical protein [Candidatus Sodalis pierantonius]